MRGLPFGSSKRRRGSRDRCPGATLIRNSQCHDQVSVIQPPTTGPIVGASTAMTPPIVVAIGVLADRKQQEHAGEHRRDQHAAGKSLHNAKGDQRGEVCR